MGGGESWKFGKRKEEDTVVRKCDIGRGEI